MDTRPLTWAALAFAFFSLFIFLGGPGSTQSVCNDSAFIAFLGRSCSRAFRYTWWIWALELFATCVAAVAIATGLNRHKAVVVGLFAVVTVPIMDFTDRYLALSDRTSQLDALIAGLMMCAIANLLVILGAGFHSARDDEDGDPKVRAVPEPTATTVGQAPVV